jgi:hypothetical protein
MQNVQEVAGYSLTFFGGTVTLTAADLFQGLGFIAMVIGLYLTWRGQQMRLHEQEINRERTAEMKRANDLKELEIMQNGVSKYNQEG